jgi:hypothetical protein
MVMIYRYICHTDCLIWLVQTACTSLNVFFSSMGLTISALKSEVMLFTRKHERLSVLVRIEFYVRMCVHPNWVYFSMLGCDGPSMRNTYGEDATKK